MVYSKCHHTLVSSYLHVKESTPQVKSLQPFTYLRKFFSYSFSVITIITVNIEFRLCVNRISQIILKCTVTQPTKKHTTCLATFLQNELSSEVAHFDPNRTCLLTNQVVNRFELGWQMCNIAFAAMLQSKLHIFLTRFTDS